MAEPCRRNLAARAAEDFRPPVFKPNTTPINRLENWARRFLDLQAGSAWNDLRVELQAAKGRLVDIGCGAQIYRPLLPTQVTYSGIDTNLAKAQFGYEAPDTHYFDGDDWGIEDQTIDVALCTEVLEHVKHPAALLDRTFRCLRPGGRLVLTVPFAARWHFIPYDYWRYTPSCLEMLLNDAGFTQIRVTARGNPLTVACYKIMALHLMLLFGPEGGCSRHPKRAVGLLLLPLLGAVALAANLTMKADWGDDCLGYTVTARRPD
jgi:SAM-dependent methyltransferase